MSSVWDQKFLSNDWAEWARLLFHPQTVNFNCETELAALQYIAHMLFSAV